MLTTDWKRKYCESIFCNYRKSQLTHLLFSRNHFPVYSILRIKVSTVSTVSTVSYRITCSIDTWIKQSHYFWAEGYLWCWYCTVPPPRSSRVLWYSDIVRTVLSATGQRATLCLRWFGQAELSQHYCGLTIATMRWQWISQESTPTSSTTPRTSTHHRKVKTRGTGLQHRQR